VEKRFVVCHFCVLYGWVQFWVCAWLLTSAPRVICALRGRRKIVKWRPKFNGHTSTRSEYTPTRHILHTYHPPFLHFSLLSSTFTHYFPSFHSLVSDLEIAYFRPTPTDLDLLFLLIFYWLCRKIPDIDENFLVISTPF